MLGMGTLGYTVTYIIGIIMLGITYLLGKYWKKAIGPTVIQEEGWSNRVIARIAILAAVSAAGGMIIIPPTNSIRLDALAGYFGALMFGWEIGAIIAMFGTFFSNLMSGFGGSAVMVPYYMMNMAFAAVAFGLTSKMFGKAGKVVGVVVGTLVNTLCLLPWVLMLGWGMMATTMVTQVLASFANCLLAAVAYEAITAAQKRRKVDIARDIDDEDDDDDDAAGDE